MGKINLGVNLDDLASGFEHVAPGVWPASIKSCKEGTSQAGEPKLLFIGTLLDGPDVGKDVPINFSLQKQALWKLRQFRDACGVPPTGDDTIDTDAFIDRRVKLAIADESYVPTKGPKAGQSDIRSAVTDFLPY